MTKELAVDPEQRVRDLISSGHHNLATSRATGVDRRTVARIRQDMGLPPVRAVPKLDKLHRDWRPRPDGHTDWKGRRYTSGAPAVRFLGKDTPASHVAFELRTGRPPVGIVKAECEHPECLTPAHVSDELERRKVRMQERALHGLDPVPWAVCPKRKHAWEEHGRIEPSLKPYCKGCNTERAATSRARRAERKVA